MLTSALYGSRRRREKGVENVFNQLMAENFLTLKKETDFQVQESLSVPNKRNSKRFIARKVIVKITNVKDKEKIVKVAREKQKVTYK